MDKELFDGIISNSVGGAVGGAFAGIALYMIQRGHQRLTERAETKRILSWMREAAGENGDWEYRTTRVIASHNNLTEDRVRYLCSHCPQIYMSRGINEDLWTLNKFAEDFREVQAKL